MTMNFGLATGALITGFFLQTAEPFVLQSTVTAVHYAFALLGVVTAVSALGFLYLKSEDGAQISGHK